MNAGAAQLALARVTNAVAVTSASVGNREAEHQPVGAADLRPAQAHQHDQEHAERHRAEHRELAGEEFEPHQRIEHGAAALDVVADMGAA